MDYENQPPDSCEAEFRMLLPFVQRVANRYQSAPDIAIASNRIYQTVASNMADWAKQEGFTNEDQALAHLFKAKIRYKPGLLFDDEMPFCDYMRIPHLAKQKHRTMASHGPRPPIVGGAVIDGGKDSFDRLSRVVEPLFG